MESVDCFLYLFLLVDKGSVEELVYEFLIGFWGFSGNLVKTVYFIDLHDNGFKAHSIKGHHEFCFLFRVFEMIDLLSLSFKNLVPFFVELIFAEYLAVDRSSPLLVYRSIPLVLHFLVYISNLPFEFLFRRQWIFFHQMLKVLPQLNLFFLVFWWVKLERRIQDSRVVQSSNVSRLGFMVMVVLHFTNKINDY